MKNIIMNIDLHKIKQTIYKAEKCSTGVASLMSVLCYFNKTIDLLLLSEWANEKKRKVNIDGIQKAANLSGFTAKAAKIKSNLLQLIKIPTILLLNRSDDVNDFYIYYGFENDKALIGDTKTSELKWYSMEQLSYIWIDGIVLLLEPNEKIPTDIEYLEDKNLFTSANKLLYLIRNKLIIEDEDKALHPIDYMLYIQTTQYELEDGFNWEEPMRYLRLRLMSDNNKNNIERLMNKHCLIYLLDCLEREYKDDATIMNEKLKTQLFEIAALKIIPSKVLKLLNHYTFDMTYIDHINDTNVTFVIPLRIDSDERKRNLDIILRYLIQIPNSNIILLEADKEPRYKLNTKIKNIEYIFIKDLCSVFHRTKYLNMLLKQAKTDIVGIWDSDVVMPLSQIDDAVNAIKEGNAVMSFPYDGRFYMLDEEQTTCFLKDEKLLHFDITNDIFPIDFHSVGGAFFVNKSMYLKYGGENQFIYGWGPEDAERVKRMEILDLPIFYSSGALVHLYHPRKQNSFFATEEIQIRNRNQYFLTCSKTKPELIEYIKTWYFTK